MFFSVWTLSLYAASDELYRIDCKTDSISFFVSTSSAIFFFFQALMTWKVHKSSFALKFLQRAFISVYFGLYFLKMLHIWDSMSSFSSLKEQYAMFSAFSFQLVLNRETLQCKSLSVCLICCIYKSSVWIQIKRLLHF